MRLERDRITAAGTSGNAELQLGKGEGIADEEPPAKLGLGVPGNLHPLTHPSPRGATARSRLLIAPGQAPEMLPEPGSPARSP